MQVLVFLFFPLTFFIFNDKIYDVELLAKGGEVREKLLSTVVWKR